MSKLYMKQKLMSLRKKIELVDEHDELAYVVSTDLFSVHDKTHISKANGDNVAYIHRKLLSVHNMFYVEMEDGIEFEIKDELFHLTKDVINVSYLDWTIEGNIMEHDYTVKDSNGSLIASTHRKWFSVHEAYEIDVVDETQTDTIVTVFIVLEHILFTRSQTRSANNSHNS